MRILNSLGLCRSIRQYSTGVQPKIAIIGSGPAGFYTAQNILKGHTTATVDIYERLPVPFGLVRFGVAPDHPEVKNVINTFTQTARKERCSFIGNVNIGRDISFQEIRDQYTAVVLAYGSDDDRRFNIPGEDLPGVLSARSFVGWYNGLPEHSNLSVDLDTEDVAVFGQGNVALDVARILLTPIDELRKTDITEHAVEVLIKSRVRRVFLIGRRGPLQVAFTTAELREMVRLAGTRPVFNKHDMQGLDQLIKDLPRPRRRLTELLYKTACGDPSEADSKRWSEASREWHLRFLRSPAQFLPNADGSRVARVELNVTELQGESGKNMKAVPTGDKETLECGLVLRSIGYKTIAIDPSVPFDERTATIPHEHGRVRDQQGLYCSGWVKRGPVGVIMSTMNDSFETGKTILTDLASESLTASAQHRGREAILETLLQKGITAVSFKDWEKIDAEEMKTGERLNKPREKIISVKEMLNTV